MQDSQIKIYKYIQNFLDQDLHDIKTRALISLSYVVLLGDKYSIDSYVKIAISYGATRRDFLNVIYCIIGDKRLSNSLMEFFRILDDNFKKGEYK